MARPETGIGVRLVAWDEARGALASVRRAVFIVEQGVPEALEWDDDDASGLHGLASAASGEAIGTARLLTDGHIGRMAVLRAWRGHGVGTLLLAAMVEAARARGHRYARLNAQVQALPFYRRFGFEAEGEAFLDAGIAHRRMTLRLTA
jgi:predicted GNAT family N-acyltransferase